MSIAINVGDIILTSTGKLTLIQLSKYCHFYEIVMANILKILNYNYGLSLVVQICNSFCKKTMKIIQIVLLLLVA